MLNNIIKYFGVLSLGCITNPGIILPGIALTTWQIMKSRNLQKDNEKVFETIDEAENLQKDNEKVFETIDEAEFEAKIEKMMLDLY